MAYLSKLWQPAAWRWGQSQKDWSKKNGRTNTRTPRTVDGHAGCKNTETTLCATSLNPTKKILTTFVTRVMAFAIRSSPNSSPERGAQAWKLLWKWRNIGLGWDPQQNMLEPSILLCSDSCYYCLILTTWNRKIIPPQLTNDDLLPVSTAVIETTLFSGVRDVCFAQRSFQFALNNM